MTSMEKTGNMRKSLKRRSRRQESAGVAAVDVQAEALRKAALLPAKDLVVAPKVSVRILATMTTANFRIFSNLCLAGRHAAPAAGAAAGLPSAARTIRQNCNCPWWKR